MKRKTITVDTLRELINRSLAVSHCSQDRRQGKIDILESILHDTGNYKGFRYLSGDSVPMGKLPGVNYKDGNPDADYVARFVNTDPTRVAYF